MGLDMYLRGSVYLWPTDEDKNKANKIKEILGEIPFEVKRVILEIGYWRKANQIHRWFVKEIQGGEDDCKEYSLNASQLEKLKLLCEKVLANPNKAKNLLPCHEGFFFGQTEYNNHYFDQLKETIKIIDKFLALKNKDNIDLYYQSSW